MTLHTEDPLGCSSISQILNLLLTIATLEAIRTVCLVAGEDGQVFDLVVAAATAVGTLVANEGAIAQQEEVRVRVEKGATGVAAKTVNVPSIPSYIQSVNHSP